MFHGRTFFSPKKGVILAFASSSLALLLMAHHLLGNSRGKGIRAMLLTAHPYTHHSSPSLASVASATTISNHFQQEPFITGILSSSEKSANFENLQDRDFGDHSIQYNASSLERGNAAVVSCTDFLCTNLLSSSDKETFLRCQRNATRRVNKFRKRKKAGLNQLLNSAANASNSTASGSIGHCRFIDGRGRGPVGLVSFPGSGNTWVRGLLQKSTGICTGAAYCDSVLRLAGFDGEGLQTTSVLVVKSHSVVPGWSRTLKHPEFKGKGFKMKRMLFDSIIFLVRNPFHALVSEWNRQLGSKYHHGNRTGLSHVELHGQDNFLTSANWTNFLHASIKRWSKTFAWIVEPPAQHKFLVVRYEDIVSDMHTQVKKMLDFLQYNISDVELSQRLRDGVSAFQRPRATTSFEHFTAEQKRTINIAILSVERLLQASCGETFHLTDYISPLS